MHVLTLDPSARCFGWAILEIKEDKLSVVQAGTIETKPHKGLNFAESDVERMSEILARLQLITSNYQPKFVVREEVVGSQSANASRLLGLVKGTVLGYCAGINLPVYSVRPSTVKLHIAGNKNADKQEIIDVIFNQFPELKSQKFNKDQREAVADAVAVYITWSDQKAK